MTPGRRAPGSGERAAAGAGERPGAGAGERPSAVLGRRLTAQLLAGPPARDPLTVTERLLAIQGQDPRGARLAIRARTRGVTAADIDHELTDERSLLITWLNRGTLHLVRSEDYAWLHPLLTPPQRTSSQTRLSQLGVDAARTQRGVAVIERALDREGPLTRHQLRDRLQVAGLPTQDQRLIHFLFAATLAGICVRGPMVGREHAYVLVRDWLPAAPPFDRDRALAELARRYLAGHAPASDGDLARWAGLPLRDARAGLEAIAGELRDGADGRFELASRPRAAAPPPPRLLGAFEPLLMGWRSRQDVLGDAEPAVVRGGIFRSFVLAEGRAVAVWRLNGRRVEFEPFPDAPAPDAEALAGEAAAVKAFLGLA